MGFFSSNKIEKMIAEQNIAGLQTLLSDRDANTRLQAASALAEMGNWKGWQYLEDAVKQADEPLTQIDAAALLGELADERAIPALEEALQKADDADAVEAIKNALETIGGQAADEALRRAGYEPIVPHMTGNLQIVDYEGGYIRSPMRDSSRDLRDPSKIEFLTAQQHLDNAIDLRDAEMAERGLVEVSVAIWLSPELADAWYLRGALFEDLERYFEAVLCYRYAVELDPGQAEAHKAIVELEEQHVFPDMEDDSYLRDLTSLSWAARRDAAAAIGDMGEDAPEVISRPLIVLLNDEDREVRHAAIEALGNIGDPQAIQPLLKTNESSWLLRFAIIEALAELGSVEGLVRVLRREMQGIQKRNPVFSGEKDPLLDAEYDLLMEMGVLAFERTGDLEALLSLAEDNAWEEVGVDEEGESNSAAGEENEQEADEELEAYVDEVAQMESLALERLAIPKLSEIKTPILRRLAVVPDLTLLDVINEGQAETEPVMIHDLSVLRTAAQTELAKR
jgi:HEAT repeat protein